MPIVREADGLAMSSRNAYLTPAERQGALCLSRALARVRERYRQGEVDIERLRELARSIIAEEPLAQPEYLEFRHAGTLAEESRAHDETLLALAVRIGKTRLIDNFILGED